MTNQMFRLSNSTPPDFGLSRPRRVRAKGTRTVKQLETVKEVRRRGMVGHSTVYRAIQRGDLTPIKLGRSTRFDSAEVDRWLSGGQAQQSSLSNRQKA